MVNALPLAMVSGASPLNDAVLGYYGVPPGRLVQSIFADIPWMAVDDRGRTPKRKSWRGIRYALSV